MEETVTYETQTIPMLDLNGGQVKQGQLPYGQSMRGKSGKESTLDQWLYSWPNDVNRSCETQACGQYQAPVILRKTDTQTERMDAGHGTFSYWHPAHVSGVPLHDIGASSVGFCQRILTSIVVRFLPRNCPNNAVCCFRRNQMDRTVFRIAYSVARQSISYDPHQSSTYDAGNTKNRSCGWRDVLQTQLRKLYNAVFVSYCEIYERNQALSIRKVCFE
jgi:hypothetical protein